MKMMLLRLVGFFVFLGSSGASAETIFGLGVSNRLYRFDSASPASITFIGTGAISGLPAGEQLIAIDFRPVAPDSPASAFNGTLYGLGNSNRLYTIDTATGTATAVGNSGAFILNGASFGTDFNPVVDRLRVVSDADQNVRLNPNDGMLTATDTALAYVAGDPGFGVNPNVVASAYTNNFGGAQVTTLYGIDAGRDVLVRQGGINGAPSPNGGQLTTIGALGRNTSNDVGFDVSGLSGVAYASLTTRLGPLDTSSDLYTIDLLTGAATLVDSIGQPAGLGAIITQDIAAPIGLAVPEPQTCALIFFGTLMTVSARRPGKRYAGHRHSGSAGAGLKL
jgi:hypothetical protein